MSYSRYAVYYLPEPSALAEFGAAWLGWDVEAGANVLHLPVEGLAQATATARKYGFHATLKPPFRLTEGATAGGLVAALDDLAARTAPATADALELAAMDGFLALIPRGDQADLARVAATCVTELDAFRAAALPEELARRRAVGLTPAQEAYLTRWGYPYVLDEFRFHMTLSGRLEAPECARLHAAAKTHLPPLPAPFRLTHLSLAGERADGRFERVHCVALSG